MVLETMLFALHMEMTEADKKHYSPVTAPGHLFRPLGWKAPDRTPKYKLLGTKVVGKDAETGTWAYMTRTSSPVRGGAITVIKEGVEFDGSIVTEITNRKVVLENGVIYEQQSVEFLGDEKGRTGRSGRETSSGTGSTESQVREGVNLNVQIVEQLKRQVEMADEMRRLLKEKDGKKEPGNLKVPRPKTGYA